MSGFTFPPPPPPPPKSSTNGPPSYQPADHGRGRGRGRGRGGDGSRARGGRGGGGLSHTQAQNFGGRNDRAVPPPGSHVNPAFQHLLPDYAQGLPSWTGHNSQEIPGDTRASANVTTTSIPRTVAGHKRKLDALRGPQQNQKSGPPTAPAVPSFGSAVLSSPSPISASSSSSPRNKIASQRKTLGLTLVDGEPQYSESESDGEDEDVDEEAMFAALGTNLTFEHNGTVMTLNTAADLEAWKRERSRNFPTKARMEAKMQAKRQIGEERRRLLTEASRTLDAARRAEQAPRDRTNKSATSAPADIHDGRPVPTADVPLQSESKLERARRELAEQTSKLEELRRQVSLSKARADVAEASRLEAEVATATAAEISTTAPTLSDDSAALGEDLADDMTEGEATELDPVPSMTPLPDKRSVKIEAEGDLADSSSIKSSGSSETSSVVSSDTEPEDSSDDDEPPEEVTSKPAAADADSKRVICKYFLASGRCRDGDACRFRHELPPRGAGDAMRQSEQNQQRNRHIHRGQLDALATTGKKSIHDRLVEQEQKEEEKLALQVIKHLGMIGLLSQKGEETL